MPRFHTQETATPQQPESSPAPLQIESDRQAPARPPPVQEAPPRRGLVISERKHRPPLVPTNGDLIAVTFLQSVLADGALPAGRVEEMAEKRSIGPRQLDRARELIGCKVQRLGNGMGICYSLPSHPADEVAGDAR